MLPLRDHEPSRVTPYVTIGLIAANAWVFFQEFMAPSLDRFFHQWALIPSLVDFGDPSTWIPFVTSQFLHAGLAHILFNMWYLWIFGDNVEGRLGHGKFLAFYLLAGVIAGLSQFALSVGSSIPMLGASGAVAGVLGAYVVFFPHHRVDALVPTFTGFWSRATLPANVVLLFWFVGQLFSGVGSFAAGGAATGGVAWFAHIGGFVFGWLLARLLGPESRSAHREHRDDTGDIEHIDLWK